MTQYHVNSETQRANICRASTPEGCKYYVEGQPAPPHFDSKEEARAYVEDSSKQENEGKKIGGLSKGSRQLEESVEERQYDLTPLGVERLEKKVEQINKRLEKAGSDVRASYTVEEVYVTDPHHESYQAHLNGFLKNPPTKKV